MKLFDYAKQIFSRRQSVILGLEDVHAHRNTFAEELQGFGNYYGELRPSFPFEMIDIISWLAIYHPDFSQTVKKITALGNPGHELDITANSDSAAEAAIDELNELARNAFPSHAGADGFINQQIRQIVVKGALCQEVVPDLSMRGVDEVYQVQVKTIRFKFEDGKYKTYQKYKLEDIELNPETFSYIPLITEESMPYGVPSFIAALRDAIRQNKQFEGIDEATAMWSILGLTWMQFDLKRNFNESETDFQQRAEKQLKKSYENFIKNMKNGVAVTGKNVELKHHNTSKNAANMKDILESTHQRMTSGLNIDPALLGYAYSTTETYATVCYETLIGETVNIQRLVKRGMERPYNLHLTLRRIPAVCSIMFNPAPSLKKYEDAQADQIRQQMVIERLDKKIIGPDEAARELGYEEAFADSTQDNNSGNDNGDEGAFMLMPPEDGRMVIRPYRVRFSKQAHKYVFQRPVIELAKKKPITSEPLNWKTGI